MSRNSELPPASVIFVEVRLEGSKVSLPLANLGTKMKHLQEGEVVDSTVMKVE